MPLLQNLASAAKDCEALCRKNDDGIAFWSLKHDASGIVAHEFAHAIEYKVAMKRLGFGLGDELDVLQVAKFHNARGSVSKEILEEAFKREGIEYNDANVMKHVSEYAKENSRETFAEALSCEDKENAVAMRSGT